MVVVVFGSHFVVACFDFVMFELLGYSRRDDWCLDDRVICWVS